MKTRTYDVSITYDKYYQAGFPFSVSSPAAASAPLSALSAPL